MAELNMSQKAGSKRAALRVDLTAMVDLAFLLVTFFMLTTTLSKPKAMDLAMPVDSSQVPVAESRSLTLCLGRNNQVYMYRGMLNNPVEPPQVLSLNKNELRRALIGIKQQVQQSAGKGLIVLVKPSLHSNYGNLVNTIDELNITQNFTYAIVQIAPEDVNELKAKHMD